MLAKILENYLTIFWQSQMYQSSLQLIPKKKIQSFFNGMMEEEEQVNSSIFI